MFQSLKLVFQSLKHKNLFVQKYFRTEPKKKCGLKKRGCANEAHPLFLSRQVGTPGLEPGTSAM